MHHKKAMEKWEELLSEELLPTLIEEANIYRFPSPFEKYPGHIDLPATIEADAYLEWFRLSNKPPETPEEEQEHFLANIWRTRLHIIKSWSVKGLTAQHITTDLATMPDIAFATWIANATQPLLSEATSLPK